MRKNEPTSIGDILAKMVKKSPLGKKLRQAEIWDRWPELAGAELCDHGRPFAIRDKTLIVEADSTVWMNRYSYHKWDILKRVNLLARQELISDIFVTLTPDEPAEERRS